MPFRQSPARLRNRRITVLTLVALPVLLIACQVLLPDYRPSSFEFLLLIVQAPCLVFAHYRPQPAALFYCLVCITMTLVGGALGLTSFLALVLIALLLRKDMVIWAVAVVCVSGFSGFYNATRGAFELDHVSVVVWALLLCAAIVIGWWLRHVDLRAGVAQRELRQRREAMALMVHDSIAANLSVMTTKLEALAFQQEDNDPVLAGELSAVADTARVTITHTRQLLDSLTTDRLQMDDQAACAASLGELIDKAVHSLTAQGFPVSPVLCLQAQSYPLPTLRILDHAVTEAVTNIIKYATPRSKITLTVTEWSSETSISFENLYRRQTSGSDSSYMGLRLLRQDLDALDGQLALTSTDETWTATMTFPRLTF